MDLEWLRNLAEQHRYKVLGGVGGFVIALLVIRFGFFWTMFILLCCGTGYWVGKRLDEDPESLIQFFDRMVPPGGR